MKKLLIAALFAFPAYSQEVTFQGTIPDGVIPDLSDIYSRLDAIESAMASHNHGAPDPEPEPTPEPTPTPDPIPPTGNAPYDLGPLPEFVQDIQWPEAPTITQEVVVTSDATWSDADGTRYLVSAGSYGPKSISCVHCEFVLDDDAIVYGQLNITGHHVSWKGGQKLGDGGINYSGPGDLLIDGLHAVYEGSDHYGDFSGPTSGWARIAIINSTFEARGITTGRGWVIYTNTPWPEGSLDYRGRDLILANVKLLSDAQTSRIQSVENHVIVDSYFNPGNTATNAHRLHSSRDIYMRDTIVVGGSSFGGTNDNGLFERVTSYNVYGIYFSNGVTAYGSNLVVNDSQVYNGSGGGGSPPLGAATGTNPPMLSWDGVTVPDHSGYGAGR